MILYTALGHTNGLSQRTLISVHFHHASVNSRRKTSAGTLIPGSGDRASGGCCNGHNNMEDENKGNSLALTTPLAVSTTL